MSTMHPTHEKLDHNNRRDSFESMSFGEQLLGTLALLVILLLAIVLKSL